MLVLLDATILTNFARVGLTSVVRDLWGDQVYTTVDVLKEYEAGIRAAGLPQSGWKQLSALALTPDERALASKLFPRLGLGERSCMAIAVSRHALVATDDKPARRAARHHGIAVIGTVGILRRCVERCLFPESEAQTVLGGMIAAGYYAPTRSLKDE